MTSCQNTVFQLFKTQAALTPDRAALTFYEQDYTYSQLDKIIDVMAIRLSESGVSKGQGVGLLLDRSPNLIISMLAIMKLGAYYVPMDPSFPTERVRFLKNDANCLVLLTSRSIAAHHQLAPDEVILDDEAPSFPKEVEHPTRANKGLGPQDLAYIYYTSGSTGHPKGVKVTQENLLEFINGFKQAPGMSESDRVLAITNITFDPCFVELMMPLTLGAKIILASTEHIRDAFAIIRILEEHSVTLIQGTPTLWRMLLQAKWKGCKSIKGISGGEPLGQDLANQICTKTRELWNVYGPTEATIWCTASRITADMSPIHAGNPLEGVVIEIRDSKGQTLPAGKKGEIYIGGNYVASGYQNLIKETSKNFLLPSDLDSLKYYKTGDIGRLDSFGHLEIFGRKDNQIKINGQRVELGEIESTLNQHPSIGQSIVIAKPTKKGVLKITALYIKKESCDFQINELTRFLKERLPYYMIPHHFLERSHFPETAAGKVDRVALASRLEQLDQQTTASKDIKPANYRDIISSLWKEQLSIEQVGTNDNYFELGGSSLSVLSFIIDFESKTNIRLQVRDIIFSSLGEMVRRLESQNKPSLYKSKRSRAGTFFMGSSDQLFGLISTPSKDKENRKGVLLCKPDSREVVCSQWSYRLLANRLNLLGYSVFQFDYTGTGDSYGDCRISQWSQDITLAYQYFKDAYHLEELSIIGARLGGSLAIRAALALNPANLVLWDPIWQGDEYIRKGLELQKQSLIERPYDAPFMADVDLENSCLGYPLSQEDRKFVSRLMPAEDIMGLRCPTYILETTFDSRGGQTLATREHIKAWEYIPEAKLNWYIASKAAIAFLPNQVISKMAEFLEKP